VTEMERARQLAALETVRAEAWVGGILLGLVAGFATLGGLVLLMLGTGWLSVCGGVLAGAAAVTVFLLLAGLW